MATKSDPDKQTKSLSLDTKELVNSLRQTAKKVEPHLGFIYTVTLLIGITLAVYLVSQSLQTTSLSVSSALSTEQNSFSIHFDDATIKKIQDLNDYENESYNVSIPDGRINPFAE